MSTAGQEKSDEQGYVNIKVKSQDGNEVFFRVKRDMQLQKLMTSYRARQSLDDSIVFFLDGQRIGPKQTPNDLEMEDGAEIDVMAHQNGGAPAPILR